MKVLALIEFGNKFVTINKKYSSVVILKSSLGRNVVVMKQNVVWRKNIKS